MALSNAQAAKRALFDALEAATYTDPQPGVWYGSPNVDHDPHDNIVVAAHDAPLRFSQEWFTMASGAVNRTRAEGVEIPVRIIVFRDGTDQYDAEDRAWELASAVATILAADQTLGGSVRSVVPSDGEQTLENVEGPGRVVVLNLTLTCQSHVKGI